MTATTVVILETLKIKRYTTVETPNFSYKNFGKT